MITVSCLSGIAQCPVNSDNIRNPLDWTPCIFDYDGNDDMARNVAPIDTDDDGLQADDVVVGGSAGSTDTGRQAIVIRLNNPGGQVWAKIVPMAGPPVVFAVTQDSEGSLLVCGSRRSTE